MKSRKCLLIIILIPLVNIPLRAVDYYWVGNGGKWSDLKHWATTTGGNTRPTKLPTAEDNVIFDQHSFSQSKQIVEMDVDMILFKNMIWDEVAHHPTLQGKEFTVVNAYGSLIMSSDMIFDFMGDLVFSGDSTAIIDLKGQKAGTNVSFNGNGTWQLANHLRVSHFVIFNNGNLMTNGHYIECSYFESRSSNHRTLNLGSSIIKITGATIPNRRPNRVIQPLHLNVDYLKINPGNSVVLFTSSNVDIWTQGSGEVWLNRVILKNPVGNSVIYPWSRLSDSKTPRLHIKELELYHHTALNGSLHIDKLVLHPDQKYIFEANQAFDIHQIVSKGNCIGNISLLSSQDGQQATLVSNDTIQLNYASLSGINTQGKGIFVAHNTVDLGNNHGWKIEPKTPTTYYWIGGSGEWNNPNNWAITSGGKSVGCLPAADDNVQFDENSFNAPNQTVVINLDHVHCRNMDWSGVQFSPTLEGLARRSLHIKGSLTFSPNMIHNFKGNYYFESGFNGEEITTNGIHFHQDVIFDDKLGGWHLNDDFFVSQGIHLLSGSLYTNGHKVVASSFISSQPTPRSLILGKSHLLLQSYDQPAVWNIQTEGLDLQAGESTIKLMGGHSSNFINNGTKKSVFNTIIFDTYQSKVACQSIVIDSLIMLHDGEISGTYAVNYWKLTAGRTYEFHPQGAYEINELDARGNCENGVITIRSPYPNYFVNFSLQKDHHLYNMDMQGFAQNGPGRIVAKQSIDNGDNMNVTFKTKGPRTLFWVGGSGHWQDINHWSTSSGGTGGVCIPTSKDIVIFDDHSFLSKSKDATIQSKHCSDVHCKDFIWKVKHNIHPVLDTRILNVHGSLSVSKNIIWKNKLLKMRGEGQHTIHTSGLQIGNVELLGKGKYQLLDEFKTRSIYHLSGEFDTNNQDLKADYYFSLGYPNPKKLTLKHSKFWLLGDQESVGFTFEAGENQDLEIDAGQSTLFFTGQNSGLSLNTQRLHKVIFTNPLGTGKVSTQSGRFSAIEMSGNGLLFGNNHTDSLIFSSGKQYTFESNQVTSINQYWKLIGNLCAPIELVTSIPDSLASINAPDHIEIDADYIQVRDISTVGGKEFYAGPNSIISEQSNNNWTLENTSEPRSTGLLGANQIICGSSAVELQPNYYFHGAKYRWGDGSTDSTYLVTRSGVYDLEVTLKSGCTITDTVEVFLSEGFEIEHPDTLLFCSQHPLRINALAGIQGRTATYKWQDGSTESFIEAKEEGWYWVEVNLDGCSAKDSIYFNFPKAPQSLGIAGDYLLCEETEIELFAPPNADSYLWSTGDTTARILLNEAGSYSIEAQFGKCIVKEQFNLSFAVPPSIDLGGDLIICQGSTITLETNQKGIWQDGSVTDSYVVSQPGWYSVEVGAQGCLARDSIYIDFIAPNPIDLGRDISLCEGEIFELRAPRGIQQIIWDDGSSVTTRRISQSGLYSATVIDQLTGCEFSDSIYIHFNKLPYFDLGPDTTVCGNQPFYLKSDQLYGNLTWPDGSQDEIYQVETPGQITVSLERDGCVARDTIQVDFMTCSFFQAYISNIFSPNFDGVNDEFTPNFPNGIEILSYDMKVYDRGGDELFKSNTLEQGWDGRHNGKVLKTGAYVYLIKVQYLDDNGQGSANLNGTVILSN